MKLLMIKLATLTIIIELQYCTAQLFPWSNLKQYFDQKTKNGPGNGGDFSIQQDVADAPDQQLPTSAERPYRHTDSNTSILKNVPKSDLDGMATLKDVTKHILKYNNDKDFINNYNDKKVNSNFGGFRNDEEDDTDIYKTKLSPVLSVNHDSTIRPTYPHKQNQNVNIQLSSNNPKNILFNDESQSQGTIVITQKPIVIPSANTDTQKSNINTKYTRVSHKTVSILPSSSTVINTKIPSSIDYNQKQEQLHPVLYVTSRPITTQVFPVEPETQNKYTNMMSTHKPMRPIMVGPYKPTMQYHNFADENSPIFLPTVPTTTVSSKKYKNPSLVTHPDYETKKQQQNDDTYIETVPSVAINIKPSNNNKPFRNSDSGLIDYLVPPPVSVTSLQPPKYGTKRRRKPRPVSTIKDTTSGTLESLSTTKSDNENNDFRILKEMTRLKPPDKYETPLNKKSRSPSRPNKKLRNQANVAKEQQRAETQKEQQKRPHQLQPGSGVKKQIPLKNIHNSHYKRDKYYNHKMPSAANEHRGSNSDSDFAYKEDKNAQYHHDAASSYLNEQVASGSGLANSNVHDGQRVEFQMHGQSGPKSYKFGYDTGKGHNRQFRYEERDTHGHVKGHYGYYDKEGKLKIVNYEADPHKGFKAETAV